MGSEYGTINFNGRTYELTNQAELTNRVFPGWWGDVEDGEDYVSEWSASGVDAEGEPVTVVWQFPAVRGEEPEDGGAWPWGDEYVTTVAFA